MLVAPASSFPCPHARPWPRLPLRAWHLHRQHSRTHAVPPLDCIPVQPQDVEPLVERSAGQLFRLVHTAPFTVAVQALLLMYQLMSARSAISDRWAATQGVGRRGRRAARGVDTKWCPGNVDQLGGAWASKSRGCIRGCVTAFASGSCRLALARAGADVAFDWLPVQVLPRAVRGAGPRRPHHLLPRPHVPLAAVQGHAGVYGGEPRKYDPLRGDQQVFQHISMCLTGARCLSSGCLLLLSWETCIPMRHCASCLLCTRAVTTDSTLSPSIHPVLRSLPSPPQGDVSVHRVAAFAKRLLQLAATAQPNWTCGALLLLSQVRHFHFRMMCPRQGPASLSADAVAAPLHCTLAFSWPRSLQHLPSTELRVLESASLTLYHAVCCVSQVLGAQPALWASITHPEDVGSAGVESFKDKAAEG